MDMNDSASDGGCVSKDGCGEAARCYKRDFWIEQGRLNYSQPHYRLIKSAKIIRKLARGKDCTLLDVGCGPATLMRLLPPNIHYHGIDMAIQDPAPNLIEVDFLEYPIRFGGRRFDIVSAQGVFEYIGGFQSRKLAEIAQLLNGNGKLILSYVNFGHRKADVCSAYNNVRSIEEFRQGLMPYFKVNKFIPTSYNWHHWEPGRKFLKTVNMHVNVNIPFISSMLAVEYFFVCSLRDSRGPQAKP
jgi:SAM-dependent methyltransferase